MAVSIFNRRREKEPFEALIMRHERMIYSLCLRMMGNRQDAEDCAQEAILSAYRAYDGFRGQADAKTWLYRIAYNACVDALRRRKGDTSLEALRETGFDPAETRMAGPSETAERNDLRRQIQLAMDQLPPDQRAVMTLRDFQQLSYQEIAQITGMGEGTVKSRLSRARDKVKNILLQWEQNPSASVKENEGRQKE